MAPKKPNIMSFPPLGRPGEKIADGGKLRLGDGWITGDFPALGRPDEKMADSGKIRLGDGWITGEFARL
jgi:hypothetical protein